MINCDKRNVRISGPDIVILIECSVILKAVKNMLTEKYGEERAMEEMQTVLDSAFMSNEEIIAKNKEMEAELPPEAVALTDMLIKTIMGGR